MPPRQDKEGFLNASNILGILTISGMILTGVFYIAPLRTLPGDVEEMKRTQIIQTEALKTLAEVASDSKETRRDVDRHDAEIKEVSRRLDRIETRQ